jgi:hypothetical protein
MAQAVTAALDSHRAATRARAVVTAPNGLGTALGRGWRGHHEAPRALGDHGEVITSLRRLARSGVAPGS